VIPEVLTAAPDAGTLARVVHEALVDTIERARRPAGSPHPYVYISSDRACLRRMVLDLRGEPQPEYSSDRLASFERGEERERSQVIHLDRSGYVGRIPFRIIGQQKRLEVRDRRGRVIAVGKIDGEIQFANTPPIVVPIEIKAWSPFLVDRIRSFDDLFDNPYTRSGGMQLLLYCYASGQPFGLLILDRAGLPLILPVTLEHHLDRVEDFLQRAEAAVDHVEAGTLPDFILDAAECQRCPYFGSVCNPPTSHPGAVVLTDPEIEQALERREALRAQGEEYNRLDRDVKAKLRGIEHGIAGPFAIRGTWGKSSKLDLPEDLRKQYTRTDPHGRFTIEITKLGGPQ
jgi:hypothetical protein